MENQNQNPNPIQQNTEFMQVEQIQVYNGNIPPIGQPYQGQLVQPQYYQQPYDNRLLVPNIIPQGGQYQLVMNAQPQIIMVQAFDQKKKFEKNYKSRSRCFSICNCICGIIISLVFVVQIMLFFLGTQTIAAGVILITANVIWILSTFIGCCGVCKSSVCCMNYYLIGMVISLLLTIISYIIKLANKDTDAQREGGIPIVLLILGLLIIIPITCCFIAYGEYVRQLIIELNESRNQIPPALVQQQEQGQELEDGQIQGKGYQNQ